MTITWVYSTDLRRLGYSTEEFVDDTEVRFKKPHRLDMVEDTFGDESIRTERCREEITWRKKRLRVDGQSNGDRCATWRSHIIVTLLSHPLPRRPPHSARGSPHRTLKSRVKPQQAERWNAVQEPILHLVSTASLPLLSRLRVLPVLDALFRRDTGEFGLLGSPE